LETELQGLFTRLCAAFLLGVLFIAPSQAVTEDGYDLWLRYRPLPAARQAHLGDAVVTLGADNPTLQAALDKAGAVRDALRPLGKEGYPLRRVRLAGRPVTLIAADTDIGLLCGSFAWLRTLETGSATKAVALASHPTLPLRVLNHWDNLDHSVERGYAGESTWNWWELPNIADPRYTEYAHANASPSPSTRPNWPSASPPPLSLRSSTCCGSTTCRGPTRCRPAARYGKNWCATTTMASSKWPRWRPNGRR
jgi:alpha-glucuronidase